MAVATIVASMAAINLASIMAIITRLLRLPDFSPELVVFIDVCFFMLFYHKLYLTKLFHFFPWAVTVLIGHFFEN
jgi:hypothetical protein